MAMKNVSHSPVTEMLSGRHKIWLIIGLALLPIADLSACIVLWAFGAASSYWILPFLLTVADLLYLLGVVLSNQRFKYAKTLFFVYILFTVICIIIWLCKFVGGPIVLANTALSAWAILHVVGIVAVAISYLYATRRFRAGRHVQLVLAIVFSAVVLLCAVFYGVTVIGDGYFGQGSGNLPLVYNYIFGGECEVADVVHGNGDSVVIPYEFNGRKVTRVSSKIFTYANIKSVTLNCDPEVELCEDIETSEINTGIKIYANKKDVDTIKQKLYHSSGFDGFYQYLHELGNNVRPIGLDKDEVYITFDYDRNSHYFAQSVIIPTWYGKKGDTFRLSDIEGVDYVQHSDASNDDDLDYCYDNVGYKGGYIMTELQDGGAALDGMTIDKSRSNVPVRFQKIYKVYAGESNDTMYHTADQFTFATVNGVKRDYKLTVLDKADELLEPFDRGEAFTRKMQYKMDSDGAYKSFTSLSELLSEGYNDITITPYWELVKPQITLSQKTADADVVYGDDFELSASVTHPLGGVQIEYEWYDETQSIGTKSVLQTNASTAGMRTYTAIVKLSAPEVTSLTTGNAAEIKVNINKRPLTVTWEHKSLEAMGGESQYYGTESVFDGKERTIQPKAQNIVNEDFIFFMGYAALHAGTSTVRATLSSSVAEKYYIAEGETYTYTIKPCPVPLTWDNDTEFVYDGKAHSPTAHAYDLSGDELTVIYTGLQTDAGENYTATATLPTNGDYTIDDTSEKSKVFKIKPWTVIATWGPTRLTYNGEAQAPTARASGVNNEVVTLNVTGQQTNANQIGGTVSPIYTATAVSANKNYTVGHGTESTEFTILPYELTVNWANTTVTYNGQRQLPTATAVGVKNQTVPVTVTIDGFPMGVLSAGDYTATATVANTNYAVKNGDTHAFKVNKFAVSVEWGSTTLTYNGSAQTPTATAKGVNGENLPLTVSGGRRNVGGGTATAAFASEQQNYTLANTTTSFTVEKKELYIDIHGDTIEYGQTPNYTHEITGLVEGDDITISYKLTCGHDEDGIIPVGQHFVSANVGGADRGNYSLNITVGVLNVTPPPEQTED